MWGGKGWQDWGWDEWIDVSFNTGCVKCEIVLTYKRVDVE